VDTPDANVRAARDIANQLATGAAGGGQDITG
jgi:hypothetical protein